MLKDCNEIYSLGKKINPCYFLTGGYQKTFSGKICDPFILTIKGWWVLIFVQLCFFLTNLNSGCPRELMDVLWQLWTKSRQLQSGTGVPRSYHNYLLRQPLRHSEEVSNSMATHLSHCYHTIMYINQPIPSALCTIQSSPELINDYRY